MMPEYKVWEIYSGVFYNNNYAICYSNNLLDLKDIIDGLLLIRKGRPFWYRITLSDGSPVPPELQIIDRSYLDEIVDISSYCSEHGVSSL